MGLECAKQRPAQAAGQVRRHDFSRQKKPLPIFVNPLVSQKRTAATISNGPEAEVRRFCQRDESSRCDTAWIRERWRSVGHIFKPLCCRPIDPGDHAKELPTKLQRQ